MKFKEFLTERESKDRLFRAEANRIIDNLIQYTKKHRFTENDLVYIKIMGKRIHAIKIQYKKIEKEYDDLVFYLIDQNYDINFSIGGSKNKKNKYIILPILNPDNLDNIPMNIKTFDKFVLHELIHYLDIRRYKKKNINHSAQYAESGQYSDYYNHPSEFNAFYQEWIDEFITFLKYFKTKAKNKNFSGLLDIKNAKDFADHVINNRISSEFVENLNNKYKRKLYKRLTDLYYELKKDELL